MSRTLIMSLTMRLLRSQGGLSEFESGNEAWDSYKDTIPYAEERLNAGCLNEPEVCKRRQADCSWACGFYGITQIAEDQRPRDPRILYRFIEVDFKTVKCVNTDACYAMHWARERAKIDKANYSNCKLDRGPQVVRGSEGVVCARRRDHEAAGPIASPGSAHRQRCTH